MATQTYKTPGVYIQEPNSFPPSIVGVETAVPCFIGFTQKARSADGRDLTLTAKRIESMAEFAQFYGGGYSEKYYLLPTDAAGLIAAQKAAAARNAKAVLADAAAKKPDSGATEAAKTAAAKELTEASTELTDATTKAKAAKTAAGVDVGETDRDWGPLTLDGSNFYNLFEAGIASFNLYNSLRLFYANGGGSCFVISCGAYDKGLTKQAILDALETCKTFIGPTMVAIPDAVLLSLDDYNDVVVKMLNVCHDTGDRMALIDLWGVDTLEPRDEWEPLVKQFREKIIGSPDALKFGAAYFPALVTSVVSADEIDISNFDPDKVRPLQEAIGKILLAHFPAPPGEAPASSAGGAPGGALVEGGGSEPGADGGTTTAVRPAAITTLAGSLNDKGKAILNNFVTKIGTADASARQLTQGLTTSVPEFKPLLAAIAATQGVLPPSGAIAGVWTTNDVNNGVWNAPANVGIATMIRPLSPVNSQQQEGLNAPVRGGAVNAIRTFQGRGSLIWGARTLDSNSNDWRYIQVRRTMIYVQQSVKQALEAMVFKPNTAQTWVTVVSMIESFLHGLWSSGGLMGASPSEAFNVQAGLGSTMTPQDVLEGIMRVHITLQMVHPAEFIELTFKQQMLGGA